MVCASFQVSGIGKVSEKMLNALGVSSCSHLGQQMALLSMLFSETAWHHLLEVSLGLGSTHIQRYFTVCEAKHKRGVQFREDNTCLCFYTGKKTEKA